MSDLRGQTQIVFISTADDSRVYAYLAEEYLSSLFTVEGVR